MQKLMKPSAIALALMLAACSNDTSDDKETGKGDAAEDTTVENAATGEAATPKADPNLTYLAKNKTREGVIETDSGLQYRVIEAGEGESPTISDFVEVHYAGRLVDGTEFDSSYERGDTEIFPAGRLIPGWTEALTMMKPGAKWELAIPAEIGYGSRGAGDVIPGGATLIFDVELIGISSKEEAMARQKQRMEKFIEEVKAESAAYLAENAAKDGVTVTDSGLQYRVLEEGTGKSPTETSNVTVHYAGTLIDGTEFDSSYKRGKPMSFPLNGVIKGWTEGVQLMKEGATYEFTIPAELGYGTTGTQNIPPHAALIFKVELVSVDD